MLNKRVVADATLHDLVISKEYLYNAMKMASSLARNDDEKAELKRQYIGILDRMNKTIEFVHTIGMEEENK